MVDGMSVQEHDRTAVEAASGLSIFYAPESAAERWLRDESVLGLIRFGSHTAISATDPRDMSIALPQLGPQRRVEVWRTQLPITRARDGDLHYAMDGEIVFGHLLIDEGGGSDLSSIARNGYARILALVDRLGYRHLVRLWNYFSRINAEAERLERYRAFCVGRYEAFEASGLEEHRLAAASAIGTQAPGVLLYFLAARQPGVPIENPRQVSAYRYPKRYSPRRPLFSRAMLKRWNGSTHLYVSGTASVVGHRTYHPGNTIEQLRETARNVEAIVARARELQPVALDSAAGLTQVKIYLRNPEDLFRVQPEVDRLFSPNLARVYLHADICRADLLLEMDAFYCESSTP